MKYAFLFKGKPVSLDLELFNIAEVLVPLNRARLGPKSFPFTLFSYVLESEYTISGPDWSGTTKAGEGELIFKGEIIETFYKQKKQVRAIQIYFDIYTEDMSILTTIFPRFIKNNDDKLILEECLRACLHAFKKSLVTIAEQEFMSCIMELIKIHMKNGVQKFSKHVQNAIEHINNNIFSELTRQDIAEILCINPSYLSYIFHNETGFTLKKYINHAKIQKAKDIMHNTSSNISEVARKFDMDLFEFSRLFKSVMGISPRDYNKLY